VDYLVRTRGVDPDARLDASQRATALLLQRTLEEHYAFVVLYTHFVRGEGWQHMHVRFDSVPALVRPLVARTVRGRMKKMLWAQGVLRHSDAEILESGIRDWRAALAVLGEGPYFFGDEPTGVDAVVFGALATSMLTPIESPIRVFLRSQPACVAYVERMRARFFPELAGARASEGAVRAKSSARVLHARRPISA
jgi:glutathione S-transferase